MILLNPQLLVLGLALATPGLACVQYSSNLNFGNGEFNAALTDNGGQKCQLTNYYVGLLTAETPPAELSCVGGYSASFNFQNYVVSYAYGSFEGSFGTTFSYYPDGDGVYWTANVWGC